MSSVPGQAEIRVLSRTGARLSVPVHDHHTRLLGWTDDGAALWAMRGTRWFRVSVKDHAAVRVPALDAGPWLQVGPGGRSAIFTEAPTTAVVRAPDGHVVTTFTSRWPEISDVAWTHDGHRAAVVVGDQVTVFDADNGDVVSTASVPAMDPAFALSEQAFAPDGSALVMVGLHHVVRVDAKSGATSLLEPLPGYGWYPPTWSSRGAIAVTRGARIRLIGAPVHQLTVPDAGPMVEWTPDGRRLTLVQTVRSQRGDVSRSTLVTIAPGSGRRRLLRSKDQIGRWAWSPDGRKVAVQVTPNSPSSRRAF